MLRWILILAIVGVGATTWWLLRTGDSLSPARPLDAKLELADPDPRDGATQGATATARVGVEPAAAVIDVPNPVEASQTAEPSPSDDVRGQSALAGFTSAKQTFYSENPDFVGLNRALRELAAVGEVDAATVKVDEEGVVRGSIRFGAADLKGSFEIRDQAFTVRLQSPPSGVAGVPLMFEETTFNFDAGLGFADSVFQSVQAHSDLRSAELNGAERAQEPRILGWTASVETDGIQASAITMSAAPQGGWMIGHAPGQNALEIPGASDAGAMQAWLKKLSPHQH